MSYHTVHSINSVYKYICRSQSPNSSHSFFPHLVSIRLISRSLSLLGHAFYRLA